MLSYMSGGVCVCVCGFFPLLFLALFVRYVQPGSQLAVMDSQLSIWNMAAIKWLLRIDRADSEHAGLAASRNHLFKFSWFWVSASCSRLKDVFSVWRGCSFKRFSCLSLWTDAAVRGWGDAALQRQTLITAHVCLALGKALCSAVKIHSFAASTSGPWLYKFRHISSSILLRLCSPHHGFVWASSFILPPSFCSRPSASVCADGWVVTSLACH